jgi:hypothetical protein
MLLCHPSQLRDSGEVSESAALPTLPDCGILESLVHALLC